MISPFQPSGEGSWRWEAGDTAAERRQKGAPGCAERERKGLTLASLCGRCQECSRPHSALRAGTFSWTVRQPRGPRSPPEPLSLGSSAPVPAPSRLRSRVTGAVLPQLPRTSPLLLAPCSTLVAPPFPLASVWCSSLSLHCRSPDFSCVPCLPETTAFWLLKQTSFFPFPFLPFPFLPLSFFLLRKFFLVILRHFCAEGEAQTHNPEIRVTCFLA